MAVQPQYNLLSQGAQTIEALCCVVCCARPRLRCSEEQCSKAHWAACMLGVDASPDYLRTAVSEHPEVPRSMHPSLRLED